MKIYNEAKTRELIDPDLENGKLLPDRRLLARHGASEAVEEAAHYEIEREFEGCGTEYRKVIDTPAKLAAEGWDEYEDILVYVALTEREKAAKRIAELKRKLRETDYRAIKFAEGELSAAEYKATKSERAAWRAEINRLEEVK